MSDVTVLTLRPYSDFTPAAFTERQVSKVPQQPDASRPHHQVPASPPQEEETTQYQRTVPGQTHTHTALIVKITLLARAEARNLPPAVNLIKKVCPSRLAVWKRLCYSACPRPFNVCCLILVFVYDFCQVYYVSLHTHPKVFKSMTACLGS